MSGFMSYFTGRRDPRESARDAIVGLRQQLLTLEKKQEFLEGKVEAEEKKAKQNATSNKRVALSALRQKKVYEGQLDQLSGQRMTLEQQVNALESANLNAETINAMRRGADALRGIHTTLQVDKVDQIMDSIREQTDLTNEISEAISNPVAMGNMIDEDELKAELEALEQEELDDRLAGADHVPVHAPISPVAASKNHVQAQAQEDDEEAQLRQLQAELAM